VNRFIVALLVGFVTWGFMGLCPSMLQAENDPVPAVNKPKEKPENEKGSAHTEWIGKSLKEMQTIKEGMTREELLKVFQEEGGISTRTQRRYVYRECPYIKVDVEFEPVGSRQDKLTEYPKDKIVKMSKPFLEFPIRD
jgi:hypothetical protein